MKNNRKCLVNWKIPKQFTVYNHNCDLNEDNKGM